MNLISKKKFIETINKTKEFYFIGCVRSDKYSLKQLKTIMDNMTHEQLIYNKRRLVKINNHQMVSITDSGNHSHLHLRPFTKYYKDNNIYYIIDDNSILIYYILND